MHSHGFERLRGQSASRPVAACGILWHAVAACGSGLDPLYVKIWRSRGLDLETLSCGSLDADRAGVDWRGWLPDGRSDWKKFSHARHSRRYHVTRLCGYIFICILCAYYHTKLMKIHVFHMMFMDFA